MINRAKNILQKLLHRFGYRITKTVNLNQGGDPVIDQDEEFMAIYDKCKEFTMTSKERMYALYQAVEYVIKADIKGDFVECGVWRGGSAMLIAATLKKRNMTERKIYLYDTFAGMTAPTKDDYELADHSSPLIKWSKQQEGDYNNWALAPLPEVQKNLSATGYPAENLVFVKGKVEETIPKNQPTSIAILRLDTDWYESTKHELVHLYPLVCIGGVLIIDDYGHYAGSKKAVDEYFAKESILLNRIDYSGRIGVKI